MKADSLEREQAKNIMVSTVPVGLYEAGFMWESIPTSYKYISVHTGPIEYKEQEKIPLKILPSEKGLAPYCSLACSQILLKKKLTASFSTQ